MGKRIHWYNVNDRQHLPDSLSAWLLDQTSLTQRLQAHCGAQFKVDVVTQCWQRPLAAERTLLGLPMRQYARIREVYLYCQQQPWVFARTVIPRTTLVGSYRRLARLGAHPLGRVLFAHRLLQRSALQITCLKPGNILYILATAHLPEPPASLWARRSLFYLTYGSLSVTEVFLPGLLTP